MKENKEEGEIVLYQPDEIVKLEVRLEDETVWLTQAQMAELFQNTKQNISLHINNTFKEKELDADSVVKESLTTAADGKKYRTKYYNLDVIISVGYRVKSIRGTQFRQWATKVLKDYMLKGYAINQRLNNIEQKMDEKFMRLEHTVTEHGKQIDFVHTCRHCHDRFLIIDNRDIYHIGASLKDLGKKLFAFSRLTVPMETITGWLR